MNNHIKENENKGFSLVELIVVIAIMAVMTSVLAPSLLGYVEKSRMQKDDSAMGEVSNAIKLALADQSVYDECLKYNVQANYSCYADSTIDAFDDDKAFQDKNRGTNADSADKVEEVDDWHYNDTTRLKDEEAYHPDGNMRGMTITFTADNASNEAVFVMKSARINKMKDNAKCNTPLVVKTIDAAKQTTMSEMQSTGGQKGQLYNKLRAVIGDNITLSSQTYRNSEYTVFIRMGSMGGNDAGAQDAVAVYGQWSGTNLPE